MTMIDTLRLESPDIAEDLAALVERQLVNRRGVDNATGEVLYDFTSGPLEGSYDHRVHVSVERERWVAHRLPKRREGPGRYREPVAVSKVASPPYLVVEGSVHKAMLGHNVAGGPEGLTEAARWFVEEIGQRLGVALPAASGWAYGRVDLADVYELPSPEAVGEYVTALQAGQYPRRKKRTHGRESLTFPGQMTAWKVYHKGPEFAEHDHRRLRKRLPAPAPLLPGGAPSRPRPVGTDVVSLEELEVLQRLASCLLRVETEIKGRKLRELGGGQLPLVGQLSLGRLVELHNRETERVVREGKDAMETVRTAREVDARLREVYGHRLGALLYATWVGLSTLGEERVKPHWRDRRYATFCRHRKQLEDAGVSWLGTDVVLREMLLPAGFRLGHDSPWRLSGEYPRVVQLLAPYRDQAAD